MRADQMRDELHARLLTAWAAAFPGLAFPVSVEGFLPTVLATIAKTDAPYHNAEHTALVTHVGVELLRCRQLRGNACSPEAWQEVVLALLCHDVGYVRGVCGSDRPGAWRTGAGEITVDLPPGATDAALQPWHVERGAIVVHEQLAAVCAAHGLSVAWVADAVRYTRFPVPDGPFWAETDTLRALVRAADLLGQLGDPCYLHKIPALFAEFQETGAHHRQGIADADAMRAAFPEFFETQVRPWVSDALDLLEVTEEGRRWIDGLRDHLRVTASSRGNRPG